MQPKAGKIGAWGAVFSRRGVGEADVSVLGGISAKRRLRK